MATRNKKEKAQASLPIMPLVEVDSTTVDVLSEEKPQEKKNNLSKIVWDDHLGVLKRIRELIVVMAAIATAIGAWFAYKALEETGKSVENSIASAIYVNNNTPTQSLIDHPEVLQFFDKRGRDNSITDEKLMEDYNSLPQEKKNLVLAVCTLHADNAELTFIQRKIIPACDWNGWWRYYCDLYDESPVFRDYLSKRSTWYVLDDAIVKEERANYLKPIDNSCIEGKAQTKK
jgi:hypothetical protein